VKVYPHYVKYTCAIHLRKWRIRIASIQAILGHKSSARPQSISALYHRAGGDYFVPMVQIEQRLEINPVPKSEQAEGITIVKVLEHTYLLI
jgi:hypothetical protein